MAVAVSTAPVDLAPQPGRPGIAVRRVADEGEVVGDRGGRHAPLLADAGVVVGEVAPPVPQHDPVVDDELGHVLVRGTDEDALHRWVRRRSGRRRRRSRRRPRTRPSARARCRAPRPRPRRSGTARAARAACRPTTCSPGRGRCGTTRSPGPWRTRDAWRPPRGAGTAAGRTSPETPERLTPSRPSTGGRGAKCARKSSYVASTRWTCMRAVRPRRSRRGRAGA